MDILAMLRAAKGEEEYQAWLESMSQYIPTRPQDRAIAHQLMTPLVWATFGPERQKQALRIMAAHQQDIADGWTPPPGYECDCPRPIDITA